MFTHGADTPRNRFGPPTSGVIIDGPNCVWQRTSPPFYSRPGGVDVKLLDRIVVLEVSIP